MPGQVPSQPVTKSVLADSTEECETACLADMTCAGFTLTDSGRGPSCELMPSWEGVEDDTTGDTTFFVCRGEFCPWTLKLWILNNIIHKDHVHSILIGSRIPTLLKSMPPFPPRLAFNRNKEKWSRGLTPQHWSFIYKIAWLWNVDLYFTVTFTHFRFVCLQIFQLKVCRHKWFLIHSFSWFFKSFKLCRGWHLVILSFWGIVRSL